MFRYAAFASPGHVPNALVPTHAQGKTGFHPTEACKGTFIALRDALAAQDAKDSKATARLVWVVSSENGKIMPAGTALVNLKQIIAKVGGTTV